MKTLIKNAEVLLLLNNVWESKKADIYIEDDVIASVGSAPDGFVAERTIDADGMLAIPGLVNCHTHAYMSIFRNLADDLSFDEWLFKSVMPLEDKMVGEDAYWASQLGYLEMIKTGTTACNDMHMFVGDVARAADKIGIRASLTRGLVGFGKEDEGGIRRINELRADIEAYKNHSRLSFMVAPHAIYTTDSEYLELCISTAKSLGVPIHTHLSETQHEVDTAMDKFGCSPVKYLDDLRMFDVKTVVAHCVYLSEQDMQILADKKVSVAANPKSNLKLANGVANIHDLQLAGANICIGTDGAASNNSLNLFGDINYTALLHKGFTRNPTVTPATDVLSYATIGGANALGMNTGLIEAGRKADIALLNLSCPQFMPHGNRAAALVYSANGSEVDTVLIDGEIVLQGGKMTTVDEAEIYAKSNEILQDLKTR